MRIRSVGRFSVCLALAWQVVLCPGCGMPAARTVYAKACAAVKARPEVGADAVLGSRDEAELHIGKNAAYVVLPHILQDQSGGTVTNLYTVRFKRVARRWEIGACFPTGTMARELRLEQEQREGDTDNGSGNKESHR